MKRTFLIISSLLMLNFSYGQHDHSSHKHNTSAPAKKDTTIKPQVKAGTKTSTIPAKNTGTKPAAQDHSTHDHGTGTRTVQAAAGTHTDTGRDTIPSAATHGTGHDHQKNNVGGAMTTQPAHQQHGAPMTHAFSRNLPMTRNGSGTSWLPDNTPMYGYMFHTDKWMYMVHGHAFLRYNKQDLFDRGSRGGSKFDAPNMIMMMGQRNVGAKGLFHFNTMFSFDPLTVGGAGYPLLFQTGETWQGQPLVDRQHPHDFISELSVSYAHALSPKSDIFLYVGYPGEPALGPSAYVHRPSGLFNPDAPLSHHWIDATHITFGVATLGFRTGNLKFEASKFTGREPDEQRWNFDKPSFNSWSGRVSYNPTEKWALQVSHGLIKEPEELHPGEDVNRTTASATYSTRGYGETFTNFTALWGMNKTAHHDAEHAVLFEGSRSVKRTTVYGRYEWVQKSVEELNLDEHEYGHGSIFPVNALTAGASYDILMIGKTKLALGGQFSIYSPDQRLANLYGDTPLAGQVYLRIYPRAMGRQSGPFYLPY